MWTNLNFPAFNYTISNKSLINDNKEFEVIRIGLRYSSFTSWDTYSYKFSTNKMIQFNGVLNSWETYASIYVLFWFKLYKTLIWLKWVTSFIIAKIYGFSKYMNGLKVTSNNWFYLWDDDNKASLGLLSRVQIIETSNRNYSF